MILQLLGWRRNGVYFFARPLHLEQQHGSMRRWNVILKAWNFAIVFDEISLSSCCRNLHDPSSGLVADAGRSGRRNRDLGFYMSVRRLTGL